MLVIDYNRAGQPVGVEITDPCAVSLARLNELLATLGQTPMTEREFQPMVAA